MELKLQDFITAMAVTSDVDNLSKDTPQVMRRENSAIQKTSTFVVSINEPHDMILPLNVVWLCYDGTSSYYKKALKRISKDVDENGFFTNTWEVLYFYDDIWLDQFYDAEDSDKLSNAVIPTGATTDTLGLVRLSYPAPEGEEGMPIVVSEGDPRLTDAREPLPHTHPEIPTSMLQHANGVVTIANGEPSVGKCLRATSETSATWDFLTEDDIQPAT